MNDYNSDADSDNSQQKAENEKIVRILKKFENINAGSSAQY